MRVATGKIRKPLIESGADPWVVRYGHDYFYCRTSDDDSYLSVSRADSVSGLRRAKLVPVWQPLKVKTLLAASKQLWAPELHHIGNRWYIYFAADDGETPQHRMFVLQSESDDPQGKYRFMGQITSPDDHWAIDGTVLAMPDGRMYFVWSGWEDERRDVTQNLYIAPMSNPWTIAGERVCISRPRYEWEKHCGGLREGINEGPEVLTHNGKIFIIFSASAAHTPYYCLGQLTLVGSDPLDAHAWQKKSKPIFRRSKRLLGPGHASFVSSYDGKTNWIIYHTKKYSHLGWKREVHAQKFNWNRDASPNLGAPK